MKSYIINYNDIFSFVFWFFKNTYKTKTVQCDMKSKSSNHFNFKSDTYEGDGVKIKGFQKYFARYFLPLFILLMLFPVFKGDIDFYLISVATALFISLGALARDSTLRIIFILCGMVIFLFGFFYFNALSFAIFSIHSHSFSLFVLYIPNSILFFLLAVRVYYDIKDNMKKNLYFLPKPRIFFYA